jgi:hypothetical protein
MRKSNDIIDLKLKQNLKNKWILWCLCIKPKKCFISNNLRKWKKYSL